MRKGLEPQEANNPERVSLQEQIKSKETIKERKRNDDSRDDSRNDCLCSPCRLVTLKDLRVTLLLAQLLERKEVQEMSLMECTSCGMTASDNDVTWECVLDSATNEIITICDECEEWE